MISAQGSPACTPAISAGFRPSVGSRAGRPGGAPGEIEPMEHNPAMKRQQREATRQYQTNACFLAPLSAAPAAPVRTGGMIAVVDGLMQAVKRHG
jgi:hypothetical protein